MIVLYILGALVLTVILIGIGIIQLNIDLKEFGGFWDE